MQAGQNPHDPLTQLNGLMGFGLVADFNPFADMGVNLNDPNTVSARVIAWADVGRWWGGSIRTLCRICG